MNNSFAKWKRETRAGSWLIINNAIGICSRWFLAQQGRNTDCKTAHLPCPVKQLMNDKSGNFKLSILPRWTEMWPNFLPLLPLLLPPRRLFADQHSTHRDLQDEPAIGGRWNFPGTAPGLAETQRQRPARVFRSQFQVSIVWIPPSSLPLPKLDRVDVIGSS